MLCDYETGERLVQWFSENKRKMPWREDPTPYHVYVSEIMLQQTRVDTVTPYYFRFIGALPDFSALASCEEEKLLKLFEGLGYYSRVRNMQRTAKILVSEYGGEFPKAREALLKLPGIGSYTAGAILSIAYGMPEPLVDGNVLRVLMRLLGRADDISDQKTKKRLEEELSVYLRATKLPPSAFNQALMELGALVCIPNGEPKCALCPWRDRCSAHLLHKTSELPVKSPKKARKTVRMTVFFIRLGNTLAVTKRAEKGLLSGFTAFPSREKSCTEAEARLYLRKQFNIKAESVRTLPHKKHVFTHVEWEMDAYLADVREVPENASLTFVTEETLKTALPVPTAYKKWNISEMLNGHE